MGKGSVRKDGVRNDDCPPKECNPSVEMTDAPCRDAPWRVRVRSKVTAEENALRMADAPRRVPTCTMCHAIFCQTPTVHNELKSSVEEIFSKSAPRGLSMGIDRHLSVPAILSVPTSGKGKRGRRGTDFGNISVPPWGVRLGQARRRASGQVRRAERMGRMFRNFAPDGHCRHFARRISLLHPPDKLLTFQTEMSGRRYSVLAD